ncbi:MAG: TPM domain-containing protein [Eubacterium sp.]
MEEREWHISTTGYGITALTDAGIEAISEQFLPYLSDGDYEEAFLTFADTCDEFVTQAKEGNIYDRESRAKRKFNPFWIPAALTLPFCCPEFL